MNKVGVQSTTRSRSRSLRLLELTCTVVKPKRGGAGRVLVSDKDRKEIKKARKDGRLAEAMLDRRAALKRSADLFIGFSGLLANSYSDRYAK